MFSAKALLIRLMKIVGASDEYFVSGSLSFLPLLGNYRQPEHDLDAAIGQELFQRRRQFLDPTDQVRFLLLSEVAVADKFPLARLLSPRTGFIHVDTPDGLLDLSCYRRGARTLVFTLGAGLTLEIPETVRERFRTLSWDGISYQAAPPELAFIPKAVLFLRTGDRLAIDGGADSKHLEDLKHLAKIMDWEFIRELLERGGLRWKGHQIPKLIRARLDPFKVNEILSLQHRIWSTVS
jgi:hypothetical protein